MVTEMASHNSTRLSCQSQLRDNFIGRCSSTAALQGSTAPTDDIVRQLTVTPPDCEIQNKAQRAQLEREMEEKERRFTKVQL